MPELQEPQSNASVAQPQRRPLHRFTRENAREFAAMGNKVRWSQPAIPITPEPIPATTKPVATCEAYPQSLERVRAKLDKLDKLMDTAEDSREWDNLSRSYERVFKVWAYLTGSPAPGSRKPSAKPERERPAARMSEPEPAPVSNTPSGSVPQSSPPTTSDDPSI